MPFASGTKANFRAGFARGLGPLVKYGRSRSRARDGIRSDEAHPPFLPSLPFTSPTRVVPRPAPKRELLEGLRIPANLHVGQVTSRRRSSCGSKSRANRLLNRVTRNLNKDPAGRFVAVVRAFIPLRSFLPSLRERSHYHIPEETNEMNNF